MKVIGITSGKGGVGKTTVAVNLAVELAKSGKKVVLLDGDLGLSNAQILLNARVQYSYGHVLTGEKTLEDIMVDSEFGVTTRLTGVPLFNIFSTSSLRLLIIF